MLSIRVCVIPNKLWANEQIFMKCCINIMSLKVTPDV